MENSQPKQSKISTPMAIIAAGVLIMIGILLTSGGIGGSKSAEGKTLSEQVGVSNDKLSECMNSIDQTALSQKIQTSVDNAMKAVPAEQRGTPYAVIIGSNGVKTEVRGAESYENVKKLIDEVNSGTVTAKYEGIINLDEEGDHTLGSASASVKIIEYSDYECPYCKTFQATLKQIVDESNGSISWTYRHWPIHQNSFVKLIAAECVAQIKGSDAFFKYSDLLFGLLKTESDSVTDQL